MKRYKALARKIKINFFHEEKNSSRPCFILKKIFCCLKKASAVKKDQTRKITVRIPKKNNPNVGLNAS